MLLTIGVLFFFLGVAVTALAAARPKTIRSDFQHVLSKLDWILQPRKLRVQVIVDEGAGAADSRKKILMTKDQVADSFPIGTWQRNAFESLADIFYARQPAAKAFPCVYATKGFHDNQQRFVFLQSDDPSEPRNVRLIGSALREYLPQSRSIGSNTSLLVVCPPPSSKKPPTLDQYNSRFWDLLRGLRIYDTSPWPAAIPSNIRSSKWAFAFDGEPLFPVAVTPLHEKRQSRYAPNFVIALQPKWVFDELLNTPESRRAATEKVRRLLKEFDEAEISPDLTAYGDPGTSEVHQLFLLDDNETPHRYPYEEF